MHRPPPFLTIPSRDTHLPPIRYIQQQRSIPRAKSIGRAAAKDHARHSLCQLHAYWRHFFCQTEYSAIHFDSTCANRHPHCHPILRMGCFPAQQKCPRGLFLVPSKNSRRSPIGERQNHVRLLSNYPEPDTHILWDLPKMHLPNPDFRHQVPHRVFLCSILSTPTILQTEGKIVLSVS